SCHCGNVAFEIDTGQPLDSVLSCNCSICSRKGSLLWFLPREQLRLNTPEGELSTYTFNKHLIKHRFCPNCGMHPYAEGTNPQGQAMAAVIVRCLEGVDLEALKVTHFDGRSA
ncbi:MAG: GFA family protein, partial [Burkholderiaceae bacterium]